MRRYDPAELDRSMLASLFDRFAEGPVRERLGRLDEGLGLLSEPMIGAQASMISPNLCSARPRT